MLLQIPDVLTPAELDRCRKILATAEWVDGRVTAGHQSSKAKDNMQIPESSEAARTLGDIVSTALERNLTFISAALPLKIFPPLFNRYQGGQSFGTHVDNAIRAVRGTPYRVRTDVSATLFLSNPEDYDGGELCVEDTYGVHRVKLPPGHMVLYPSSSLHHVRPVTRGARIASFFWIQSLVRDDGMRTILFDLDTAIQKLTQAVPENPTLIQLTGIYHNLLRQWADT